MIWRAPARDDRSIAALWAVAAGLFVLMRPIWLAAAALLPACPWHAWTGWPCPGCGTTRALVHLLHGDLGGALRFNPLAAGAAAAFVAGGAAAPLWLTLGGRIPALPDRSRPAWVAALGVAIAGNWAWLCASGV
ncbi:MAG TPA: DUF2752 domain-containing protein [Candidatus Polarisedimenticolaceae bacterium]|nr:DUF2752 domain-containing protein [Candidatus Polarisedimenticolaceae bacterium]